MSLASSVYAKSLAYLRHGQALWIPEPVGGKEVLIGDVGYLLDGGFYRVFNVTRPPHDPINSKGVPHNFEVLRVDVSDDALHYVERYIPSGSVLSSLSVREAELTASASGGSGPLGAGFAYRFSCNEEHGAVLLLKDHATSKRVHPTDTRFMEYMGKHWRDWHKFFVKERGLGLPPEEIVFVSGWVKTTEWAVAAFVRGGSAHELSFQADGASFANAKFSVAVSQGHSGSVQHRTGPGIEDASSAQRQDQCIFLSYFKVKRSAFLITSIVAAAEPKDDEPPPPSPSELEDWCNVPQSEDEFSVEASPAHEPPWEPLDVLLDYILQNSGAEVAIASHASLCHLEWSRDNELIHELDRLRPSIVVNNNMGMLESEVVEASPEIRPDASHTLSSRPGDEMDELSVPLIPHEAQVLPELRRPAFSHGKNHDLIASFERDDGQEIWWGKRPEKQPFTTSDGPYTAWKTEASSISDLDLKKRPKQRYRISDRYSRSSGLSTPSLVSVVSTAPSTWTSLYTSSAASIRQSYASSSVVGDDESQIDTISEDEDEDEDAEEEVTSALVIAEQGRGIIVRGDALPITQVEINAGTTHLMIGSSASPNAIPTCLANSIPRIANTLLCLDISANFLEALPPALRTCLCLEELNIASNPLYELPAFVAELASLRVLVVDSTGLSSLPPALGSLKKLHTLSAQRNKMRSLPSCLCMLSSLETLLVDGNPFEGPWRALVGPLLHDMPDYPPPSDSRHSGTAPTLGSSKRRSFIPIDHTRVHPLSSINAGPATIDINTQSQPGRRRPRVTGPCQNCHASERMCDRQRPCGRCNQLDLASLCVYKTDVPSDRKKTLDPSKGVVGIADESHEPVNESGAHELDSIEASEQRHEEMQARQARLRVLHPIMKYLQDMHDLSVGKNDGVAASSRTTAGDDHLSFERTPSPAVPPSPETSYPHRLSSRSSITTVATGAEYKDDKQKRTLIIQEILETERFYVKSLQELVDIYIKPAAATVTVLSGTGPSVIPAAERKIVFSGLEALFPFHKESFLPALEKAAGPLMRAIHLPGEEVDGGLSLTVARVVADVFVSHAAFLKVYSTYIDNFDVSVQRIRTWTSEKSETGSLSGRARLAGVSLYGRAWQEDATSGVVAAPLTSGQKKRIKAFLKRCRMNPRHSQLNLEGYLLLPVQRIPRYRMLLEELARSCPPAPETTYDPLGRAVEEMTSLATSMNQHKREADMRKALVQWQSRIRGKFPSPLVQPYRRYIMEGPLYLTRVVRKAPLPIAGPVGDTSTGQIEYLSTDPTPRDLFGILCNDLLILCRQPSEPDNPNSMVDLWAVLRMETVPEPASIVNGNTLRLVDNKAILYVDAPSSADALTWCAAINLHIPKAESHA